MAIPILLLALATLSAAVVAYGTNPAWGGFEAGLQWIVWSHRLQWWLVALSLLLCLTLIALVILGRRRAWWLIGLGPVLALFVHHFAPFAPDRAGAMMVVDNPRLVDVASLTSAVAGTSAGTSGASVPADNDWVVGVTFGETAYAYPYAALFRAPVVFQSEHGSRMVLFWSAYANRAVAVQVSNPVRARDFEVVSEPANALLVYDRHRAEFINGLKGLYLDGREPTGFGRPLLTTKTTWKRWRTANPRGKVMAWSPPAEKGAVAVPTGPLVPAYAVPGRNGAQAVPAGGVDRPRVTLVGYPAPAAVDGSLLGPTPVNLSAGGTPVMAFRMDGGMPRAFTLTGAKPPTTRPAVVTAVTGVPRFVPAKADPRHPEAVFHETVSDTLWTADGAGVARTKSAGGHLKALPVDEDVDRATVEYWYRGLRVLSAE